jgi:hypothetical protein
MQIALRRRSLRAPTVTRSLILGQPLSATMEAQQDTALPWPRPKQFPVFVIGLPSTGSTTAPAPSSRRLGRRSRPVWSARFMRYSKRSADCRASVMPWRATGTWSKSSRWRTSRLSCRAGLISVTRNRAGRRSSRRPHWGSTPACAAPPAVMCSRPRSTLWRASIAFPRRGSPRRPGAYRRPSASTSPMP